MSQAGPIALFALAAVLGAFGQLLVKRAATAGPWFLLGGALAFTGVLVLFTFGYRLGGRIGVVYPVYATTFVWGLLLGAYVDGEPLSARQIAGVATILLGTAVVATSR